MSKINIGNSLKAHQDAILTLRTDIIDLENKNEKFDQDHQKLLKDNGNKRYSTPGLLLLAVFYPSMGLVLLINNYTIFGWLVIGIITLSAPRRVIAEIRIRAAIKNIVQIEAKISSLQERSTSLETAFEEISEKFLLPEIHKLGMATPLQIIKKTCAFGLYEDIVTSILDEQVSLGKIEKISLESGFLYKSLLDLKNASAVEKVIFDWESGEIVEELSDTKLIAFAKNTDREEYENQNHEQYETLCCNVDDLLNFGNKYNHGECLTLDNGRQSISKNYLFVFIAFGVVILIVATIAIIAILKVESKSTGSSPNTFPVSESAPVAPIPTVVPIVESPSSAAENEEIVHSKLEQKISQTHESIVSQQQNEKILRLVSDAKRFIAQENYKQAEESMKFCLMLDDENLLCQQISQNASQLNDSMFDCVSSGREWINKKCN